jgi:hypothetical protein
MAQKKQPGVPKLRAVGTDLYVRYYGNEDHEAPTAPPDPVLELHATQLKLTALPTLSPIAHTDTHRPNSFPSAKTAFGTNTELPSGLKAEQLKLESMQGRNN